MALPTNSHTSVCNKSSISNPLLVRLMQEPNSGVKTALDLEANSIPKADTFFWESIVTMLKSSSPKKAQLVLEWKLEKMLKENERDQGRYSDLIFLCGKVQYVSFALHVFTSMEAHGIRPTSAVFNSLITTCLSSGNVATALSLFEIMERSKDFKPNSTTYNAFISLYSKLGDSKAMQAWYSASKTVGFSPNVQTFESLISWSIKSKEFDIANTFYEEMMSSGVTPNVAILENMLEGLCKQKKLSKIRQFLKFILDGGWNLNKRMTENLLELYSQTGRVGEMEELLVSLMRSNHEPVVLSQVHCGIIRMYALSDRLDDLEYSVGRMLKQGLSFTCPGDVEQVICSYFRRAAYDRLDLFLERIEGSYKLTKSTYDLLVAGYKRAGLSDKLDLVMKNMKLAGS
ncbi:Pentatricopeptide repeat [Macleaya cordata]|uniref:Pentatricopeptide repeat n=1 Tax=Macleaya cordata TaxID=56857 RepID=A0A200RCB5_MACCD|nr:Pentatricopeptide repeat [Macleaya cordata]